MGYRRLWQASEHETAGGLLARLAGRGDYSLRVHLARGLWQGMAVDWLGLSIGGVLKLHLRPANLVGWLMSIT